MGWNIALPSLAIVLVAIVSISNAQQNCIPGYTRIYNGTLNTGGMLQICDNSKRWGAVCDRSWDCNDARVACRQLGYNHTVPVPFTKAYFGTWSNVDNGWYYCSGEESDLSHCPKANYNWWWYRRYCSQYNTAGIACYRQNADGCHSGELRLQNGKTINEGRLEYCHNGTWSSFCSIQHNVATVACRQLGYKHYTWAKIFTDGKFGEGNKFSLFQYFSCGSDGGEKDLSKCTKYSGCGSECHGHHIGIRCFNPGLCNEGAVRLANGTVEQEGRLEICVNGVWGSVCDYYWDQSDAYVACKQLGYSNAEPSVYYGSYFGEGYGPVIYSYLRCRGWEKSLSDCPHHDYSGFTCPSGRTAGLICRDSCTDGQVRLVGGNSKYEGTVEMCFGNLWGLVAESGWGMKDAEVTCRQLGFPTEHAQGLNSSRFGKPRKPVHLNNVYCTGSERWLSECSAYKLSLGNGRTLFNHVEVAGVSCHQTPNMTGMQTMGVIDPMLPSIDASAIASISVDVQMGESTGLAPSGTMIALVVVSVVSVLALAVGIVLLAYWRYSSIRNRRPKGTSVTIEHHREIAGPTDSDTVPLYAAPMKHGRRERVKEQDEDFFDTKDDN